MKINLILLVIASFCIYFSLCSSHRIILEQDLRPQVPEGWHILGHPLPDDEISLLFVMKLRNLDQLEKIAEEVSSPQSSNYGRYKTLEEIHALTGPSQDSIGLLTSWLVDSGVTTIHINQGGAFIRAIMSVRLAEQLLDVTYQKFAHTESGLQYTRAIQHYSLPAYIADHVALVGGVSRFPRMPKSLARQQAERPTTRSVTATRTTPEFIQIRYNVTIAPKQSNNIQAVTSFLGQYYNPNDLVKFQTKFALPPMTIENTIGPNDPSKPGVEASLDVQYLTGVNNDTVRTWVWSTSGEMPGGNEPYLDWLQAVDNTTTVPNLFSISYQDLEYTVSLSYATSVNAEYMKNTVRGITFITGSGDWGVGCEDSSHCNVFTSDFSSSSPYVTSTGGTTLSGTSNEIGVAFSSGGFSNYFGQPSYQAAAIQKWMSQSNKPPQQYWNATGRAFPDISAISTNFQVYVDGVVMPVAGTSASTPTVASMLSMINSLRLAQGKPTLGNVNPALYAAWSAQPHSFNDITSNQKQDKGCCPTSFSAVVGWDPVTGLGTPNYGYLASYLLSSNNFNFPNNDS